MKKIYTVTKDVSASLTKLKKLERHRLIKIAQVDLENVTPKIANTPKQIGRAHV